MLRSLFQNVYQYDTMVDNMAGQFVSVNFLSKVEKLYLMLCFLHGNHLHLVVYWKNQLAAEVHHHLIGHFFTGLLPSASSKCNVGFCQVGITSIVSFPLLISGPEDWFILHSSMV